MRLPSTPCRRRREAGVALVIVLAFVVLLTGLIVAFFARSVTGRQLSNSSANQTKAAVLAQSASDIVIAGFKSEIVAGSATPAPSPSPAPATIYVPLAAVNAVPVRYPTPAPSPGPELIPNLVRESKRGDSGNGGPLPTPAVPSYASAVNSTADADVNGRKITPARWNSHFLIPSQSTTTVADSTPDAAAQFSPPDWVLMTRNGPAVKTEIGTGATALNNSAASNGNFVIGRYAYAVYDEGGLLDMNVAGHPTPVTAPSQTGFTTAQVSRKGSLAMADLTQLPLVKSPGSTSDYLSQATVDSIVGWRNYASAGFTTANASYPGFTFNATQSANWFTNFVVKNTSGYLKVYGGTASNNGPTDQAFLSRQQLLKLRSSVSSSPNMNFGANVLQYMGTFSRGLEQPSFVPAHIQYPTTAPAINNLASTAPPGGNDADGYFGNNDAAGTKNGVAGQDLINPSFLSVRVGTTFTRLDGTTALAGEPLVKRRFSLRRLAWLTYKGPSANNMTDANVKAAITAMGGDPSDSNDSIYKLVAQGNDANILKYFGLAWNSANGVWTYNHGSDSIKTLADVAAANREPDCAELLKAAINAGSLAKGGPNLNVPSTQQSNYQYTVDTTLDYNVLQILANLVDQFDTDSYPTIIQIKVIPQIGAVYYRAMRGVEDLPYFYRYHPFTVVTRKPVPLLAKTDQVAFVRVSKPSDTPTVQDCKPGTGVQITDPGEAYLLWAADVWNPHDPNLPRGTTGSRPPRFRLQVLTQDPIGATVVWKSGARPVPRGSFYDLIPPQDSIPVTYSPIVAGTTDFTFSDDGGKLFREPTLLWRADAPDNCSLTPESGSLAGPYKDINTNVNYYGVCIGKSILTYTATVSGSAFTATPKDGSDLYLFQAGHLDPVWQLPTGSYNQYTFRLQYQNPATLAWVTYDEKYPDLHGLASPNTVVNPADWDNNQWQNPYWSKQMNDCATGYDPRVARFGIGTATDLRGNDGNTPKAAPIVPFLETAAVSAYQQGANNATGNTNLGNSRFTIMPTIRPGSDKGNQVNYSNPGMTSNPGKNLQMRWFSGAGYSATNGQDSAPLWFSGLIDQNNPAITIQSRKGGTTSQIYYEDADGVARRAMGAYADTSLATDTNPPIANRLVGLPEATASTFTSGYGVGAATAQSQSRPTILNRPFQSVAEMSYASRGGVWKQIDFFTPESGDTALLDTFCINDPPPDALVAGKVNLNTHQTPVLKAVLTGAYRDEVSNYSTSGYIAPSYAQAGLAAMEADNIAKQVYNITTDTTSSWRGPFANVGGIVGRFIANPTGALNQPDAYTYKASAATGVPSPNNSYTYAGLSASLDSAYGSATSSKIQRMRETAIRPLADAGQTRVWNLMIDVVAQTGRYGGNAIGLNQFIVEGEKRCWVHVAIDRYTGEIIDRQTEEVSE